MELATILAIAQGANTLYKYINPDRRTQLINDVLESQTQFRDTMARQAFGNFTAAERQQIQAAAEPQVNQIAGNVAARGLGTSGAGLQVISKAQQAPFQHAQQNAMANLSGANQSLLNMANFLPQGDAVTNLLGSLQKKVAMFNADNDVKLTIQMLFDMLSGKDLAEIKLENSLQGYSMPDQTAFQQRGTLQYGGGRI